MVYQRINNALLYGQSTDTKPTTFADNTIFIEWNTGSIYRWNLGTTTWVLIMGPAKTETLTNKSIDAATNTLTNIGDAAIASHTSTKITITAKAQLNSAIVYNDQANAYGAFDQTFRSGNLKINNPANTFAYAIVGSAITAARNVTLPLLTADDEILLKAFAATITGKTINATNNTITDTSTAVGDILKSDGSKFTRFAKGTGLQILRTNSGGTDLEWATISSWTEAKGTATKNGDAATTAFTIAHGLGSTPSFYTVTPNSADANSERTVTVDATNITVTYNFAPPSGTGNLSLNWRAAI